MRFPRERERGIPMHSAIPSVRLRLPTLLVTLALLAAAARAQTNISGALSDSTTGPLTAGVYHAVGAISVSSGQILTVHPDAYVKAYPGVSFTINGTLNVIGTSGNPAIFTSIEDDTAGGDTNANGPSVGTPGDWAGIRFTSTAGASSLSWADIRFGGSGGYTNVYLQGADVTLANCTLRDSSRQGMNLTGTSLPTVSGCAFENNAGVAINAAKMDGVPLFSGNSATGNAGDYLLVTSPSPTANVSIVKDNYPNGALVLNSGCTVPTGVTMALGVGVVLKLPTNSTITVNGTLDATGSASEPVVFTDLADDDWGGDTNNNGPSSGTPGNWYGLRFTGTSDASVLSDVLVRFGGGGGYTNVYLQSADITMTGCTSSDSSRQGLNLTGTSLPTVSGCTFSNNAGIAIDGVKMDGIPLFSSNNAATNAGDYMRVTSPSPTGNVTIVKDNVLNGALVLSVGCTIPTLTTLALQEGVVFKMPTNSMITVNGTLNAAGSATEPVVFTDIDDDDWGGDTNNNGPSSGAPGHWQGIRFVDAADASELSHTVIRFGGYGGYSNLHLQSADIALTDCTSSDCSTSGMNLSHTSRPTVRFSDFSDNQRYAVENVEIGAVSGFSQNTASDNVLGDYLDVNNTTTSTDVTIAPHMLLNGVFVASSAGSIATGATLTFESGVPVKLGGGQMTVNGSLNLLGTLARPVVFTSIHDDTIAGDTNKNGAATVPAPGDWIGLRLISIAEPSLLRSAEVRYAGSGGWPGVSCDTPAAVLDGVRVDHSGYDGFGLSDLSSATRLVAWDCTGDGVYLSGGGFDVTHVSAVGNGDFGVRRTASHTGSVVNSIAWSNASGNYTGFAGGGDLRYSDGDPTLAGSFGNIDMDPLFLDELGGDLNLQALSPCVDTGDPTTTPDPGCTPPDMGAYWLDSTGDAPEIYCTAKVNSVGCLPGIDFVGFASATDPAPFAITAGEVVNNKNAIFFYGLTGRFNLPFQGGFLCVKPPTKRTPVQNSGGNSPPNDCSGTLTLDFNAWIQAGSDVNLIPGVQVNGQYWYRDPQSPSKTGLTDGIEVVVCP